MSFLFILVYFFFFSSRRRYTRWPRDWSSDVCSSDLALAVADHGRPLDCEAALAGRFDDRVEVAQGAGEIGTVAILCDALALELPEEILERRGPFGVAAARRHCRRDQREDAG